MFAQLGINETLGWAIIACLCMMAFDIITGFMAAWKNHEIESKKMREGICHKGTLVLLIVLAWLCEVFILHVPELGISIPLVIPVCVIIFAIELTSILENLSKMYPEISSTKIMQLFQVTKGVNNDNEGD